MNVARYVASACGMWVHCVFRERIQLRVCVLFVCALRVNVARYVASACGMRVNCVLACVSRLCVICANIARVSCVCVRVCGLVACACVRVG